jgi:DNA-binding MarR family transcriptional regulator
MQLQHHSTVELVDRLVDRNFLCRLRSTNDRRQVLVKLTHDGEEFLEKLSLHHLEELQSAGPTFVKVLNSLLGDSLAENPDSTSEVVKENVPDKPRKDRNHG